MKLPAFILKPLVKILLNGMIDAIDKTGLDPEVKDLLKNALSMVLSHFDVLFKAASESPQIVGGIDVSDDE